MPDAESWAQTWRDDHRALMSQPDDAMPSESATSKFYDSVTASLIDDTPSLDEVAQAITSTPIINPLAVMRGQQSGPEMLPSTIMRAQRSAAVKERAQIMALLQDSEAHEMRKAELGLAESKLAFDVMKQAAAQGQAGIGAIYKTFMDLGKDMDPERANQWLGAILATDISGGVDEASGRGMALQALANVGGMKPKAPAGGPPIRSFMEGEESVTRQWTGRSWEELGRAPRWKTFSVLRGQKVSRALEPVAEGLLQEGLRPNAVAGIIANLQHESSGNPEAVGDGGTSFGLAQWHGPRADALADFAASMGIDPRDPQAQTAFLVKELQDDPALLDALNEAPTPGAAADLFQRKFERPARISPQRSVTAQGPAAEMVGRVHGRGGEMPTVRDAAEYNALPSGTMFIDPEGRRRRKP